MIRLGVLGGMFDPVHYGHLRAAEDARTALELDRVLFIPAGQPAHKAGSFESAGHRLAMLRLATADCPAFEISDMELNRPETSFSVHTLEALTHSRPNSALTFIMGMDAFLELETWYRPDDIIALADLAVLWRPPGGFDRIRHSRFIAQTEKLNLGPLLEGHGGIIACRSVSGKSITFIRGVGLDISSTLIRGLLGARQSARFLLPGAVLSYILLNKLYGLGTGGPVP